MYLFLQSLPAQEPTSGAARHAESWSRQSRRRAGQLLLPSPHPRREAVIFRYTTARGAQPPRAQRRTHIFRTTDRSSASAVRGSAPRPAHSCPSSRSPPQQRGRHAWAWAEFRAGPRGHRAAGNKARRREQPTARPHAALRHGHDIDMWEPARRCPCPALPKRARSSRAKIPRLRAALPAQRWLKGRAALLQH